MRHLTRIMFFVIASSLSFSSLAWTIEQSFDVQNGGELNLDTDIGSIDIETHTSDTIEIEVEVHGLDEDEFKVTFDHEGADLNVRGDAVRRNFRHKRVEFVVVVPEQYNVDLSTHGGSISVSDLKGAVDVDTSGGTLSFEGIVGDIQGHTSGGSIDVDQVDGEIDLSTSGGSISVRDVTSHVDVETSGGTISVKQVGGNVEAETSGGSITIRDVAGGIEASTSGGSVEAQIPEQPQGDVMLSTSGGSVSVELGDSVAMNVNAKARRIRSDFPIDGQTSAKRRLTGELRGGGPDLDLYSSGGGISIERL